MSGSQTFLQQFANFFDDNAVARFELTDEEIRARDIGIEFYIGIGNGFCIGGMELLYMGNFDSEHIFFDNADYGKEHWKASVVQELINCLKRFMQLPETTVYFPDNVPEEFQSESYFYRADGNIRRSLEEYKYAVIFKIFWMQRNRGELNFIYEALMTDEIRDAYIRALAKQEADILRPTCFVDAELAKSEGRISYQQAASIMMCTVNFILDFQSSITEQTESAEGDRLSEAEADRRSDPDDVSSVGIDDMNDEVFEVIRSLEYSDRTGARKLAEKLRNLVVKFPNVFDPLQKSKPARFLA